MGRGERGWCQEGTVGREGAVEGAQGVSWGVASLTLH